MKCYLQCSLSTGRLLGYHTLKVNKALQNLELIPDALQELLQDLDGVERLAATIKSTSNTCYTQICNHIYGFKHLQRQLQHAIAVTTCNTS